MNVVFIICTPLAGAPIRIANALNAYTDYKIRVINLNPSHYGDRVFPEDLSWQKDKEECIELIKSADILHFHHFFDVESENNPFGINFRKFAPKAKIVRHFHTDLNQLSFWINIPASVITGDPYPKLVIPHYPERTFLDAFVVPNIIPINDDILLPKDVNNNPLKVFYSASSLGSMWITRWNTKGYPEILKKFENLKKKNKFDFSVVTNTPYTECQKIKQESDIVIGDITSGSYHLTDLESLSMGKPTFTYLDSRIQLTLTTLLGCTDLPFVNTRIEEIDLPFLELLRNKELQREVGKFSRHWIEKYYNEQKLVKFYEEAYEKLLNGEPLKRQGYLDFSSAKTFLYNDLYDLQWEARKNNSSFKDWPRIIKDFFQKLFSVKNEYKNNCKRKIIRILGLKISFNVSKFIKPKIKDNTFLLWEPCLYSHGEVIPGYTKYLLDLGYEVSVLMTPDRIKEGVFSRISNEKIFLNNMTQEEIWRYFSLNGLKKAKGLIITTARNACDDNSNYADKLNMFNKNDKILFVEHEVAPAVDNGFWNDDIITLAPIDYKDSKSVVVNPNYFGEIKTHKKNKTVNFIVIGALESQRKNFDMLFSAVKSINDKDFKVTIIGNGDYSFIPSEIAHHFEIKGRLDFKNMYDCIEKSDYILSLLDKDNKAHYRYITTGTSGTYKLSYGFLKPLIIEETFCKNRFLNNKNSIIYSNNKLVLGLTKAIEASNADYDRMVYKLRDTTFCIRKASRNNLKNIISRNVL